MDFRNTELNTEDKECKGYTETRKKEDVPIFPTTNETDKVVFHNDNARSSPILHFLHIRKNNTQFSHLAFNIFCEAVHFST